MKTRYLLILAACSIIAGPTAVQANQGKAKACAGAIAAFFISGCQLGASVGETQCRGAIQDVQSRCDALKECRYACHTTKKELTSLIKDEFKTCKTSCKALSNKDDGAKRKCKSLCRQNKKAAKKAARKSKRNCKSTCKNDYGSKSCRRARLKLTAWAAAVGASGTAIAKACGD